MNDCLLLSLFFLFSYFLGQTIVCKQAHFAAGTWGHSSSNRLTGPRSLCCVNSGLRIGRPFTCPTSILHYCFVVFFLLNSTSYK